jgi:hypothetical protein
MRISQRHVNRFMSHERLKRCAIDSAHYRPESKSVGRRLNLNTSSLHRVVKNNGTSS